MIRAARVADLPVLLRIEERSFSGDRLTRRNFHHLLTRGKVSCLVDERDGTLGGYALVLYRGDSALARLYSFAVAPEWRGNGIGRALLEACERDARRQGCRWLRLEVRRHNRRALALYRSSGFREIDTLPDYYHDHADAIRMEKPLVFARRAEGLAMRQLAAQPARRSAARLNRRTAAPAKAKR
jgi:ribosomal-protein-alanine acetyltransferase